MATQHQLFATRIEPAVSKNSGNAISELYAKIDRLGLQLINTQKQAAQSENAREALMLQNNELSARLVRQADLVKRLTAELRVQSKAASASHGMTRDIWRRLLQLCHPDKHANSEAATLATQWLNKNKPA